MYSYEFRQWLSFFYLYCIFGWCFESVYVSLRQHRLVNRGFLKGPWLPLYGSGAITVLMITLPVQQTPGLVYVTGALGATVLELLTGEAMVKLFKVRYWDYSDQRFHYKGHICLSSSAAWGFLSLLMVYQIQPRAEAFIFGLHKEVVSVSTFLITVCMVYDFSNAFREAMDLKEILEEAERVKAELEKRAAEKKRLLEATSVFAKDAMAERLEKEMEQLEERMSRKAEWFLMQNPTSRFMTAGLDRTAEIRERIRTQIRERKKEKNTKSS